MHAELIARLESLEGPDREVDGLVAKALDFMAHDAIFMRENVYGQPVNQWSTGGYGNYLFLDPDEFTASLDATNALVKLQGLQWLRRSPSSMTVYRKISEQCHADGPSPAIALLIAALRALDQKEAGK